MKKDVYNVLWRWLDVNLINGIYEDRYQIIYQYWGGDEKVMYDDTDKENSMRMFNQLRRNFFKYGEPMLDLDRKRLT